MLDGKNDDDCDVGIGKEENEDCFLFGNGMEKTRVKVMDQTVSAQGYLMS